MKNSIQQYFVDRVLRFASVHDLFIKGGKYIVALSGGADSVSLLLVMKALSDDIGIEVEAAHCNFHLRGEESDRDEYFCKDICRKMGIPLHLVHFDTKGFAELHHVSIEMAARDLRYKYFENLRCDIGATDICVAHHRDDSVETVLLNLVRGTGIRGLRGILPRNGHIIRPLLCVTRDEIIGFLSSKKQQFVTDSTNLVNDVKRNKIRLDVIPLLKTLNPNVCQSIFESSLHVNEVFKVYDNAMNVSEQMVVSGSSAKCCDGKDRCEVPITISIERLLAQVSFESTLFHILGKRGFSSAQVMQISETIMEMKRQTVQVPGKLVCSSTHELLFDRGCIIVQPLNYGVMDKPVRIPETGTYIFPDGRRLKVAEEMAGDGYKVSRERMCVCVDAASVIFPLTVRQTIPGDRFVPFGMNQSKLVSDFLTDRKCTLFDKRRQLVVADADGKIVWLVGERVDNRVRITPKSAMALKISMV